MIAKGQDEIYIGDGVYASFDGWYIWLRAPRENGDHEVALEPASLSALIRYADGKFIKRPPA